MPGMRRGLAPALLAAATLVVAGCGGFGGFGGVESGTTTIGSRPYTIGSGKVVTDNRDLAAFHALRVGPGIAVVVAAGTQPKAAVTIDDNLTSMITTTVAGGTLTVTVDGGLQTHHSPKVTVTAAGQLDALAADSGSTIDAETIDTATLSVTASSGSTVRASGKTGTVTLHATSGSTVDLRNLTAETATVHVDSGSTAHVNATKSATGECTSGSTTIVHGHPSLSISNDTSSTVRSE